ncbi:MAG: DUF6428 family protein [Crocinitomicaceae bacterium]
MKLSTFKSLLSNKSTIGFTLPSGEEVPSHFHVTEVGQIDKRFIDCGGTLRNESVINFQLWEANDYDHRLAPDKLLNIINLAQNKLELGDFEIEVEYQGQTIQKFGIEEGTESFLLSSKQTDCLAMDSCGVPAEKIKISMAELNNSDGETCTPGGGCC